MRICADIRRSAGSSSGPTIEDEMSRTVRTWSGFKLIRHFSVPFGATHHLRSGGEAGSGITD
jgi:hypothetical protein